MDKIVNYRVDKECAGRAAEMRLRTLKQASPRQSRAPKTVPLSHDGGESRRKRHRYDA